MKPYAFLAMIVAIIGFFSTVAIIETPKQPRDKRIYVLPRVKDMPTVANPLQF